MLGNYISIYKVISNDIRLDRRNSSRFVTTFILFCIEQNIYEKALVTKMSTTEPWKAEAIVTSNIEEIISAQGSKYTYVGQKHLYPETDDKTIIVGLPCQISTIQNNSLKISLMCGINSGRDKINRILRSYSINKDDIIMLNYRDPDTGKFKICTKYNKDIYIKAIGLNYIYALPMCKICNDFSGHFSDISVGDYDYNGSSVIISRTFRGEELLQEADNKGIIKLNKITIDDVISKRTSSLFVKELGKSYSGNPIVATDLKLLRQLPILFLNNLGRMIAVYYKYIKGPFLYRKFKRGKRN